MPQSPTSHTACTKFLPPLSWKNLQFQFCSVIQFLHKNMLLNVQRPRVTKGCWIDVFLAPICLILNMCLTDILVKPCVKIFLLIKLNLNAAFLFKNICFDRVISNLSNARQIINI